jgi:nicotinamide-nucleotide amidase
VSAALILDAMRASGKKLIFAESITGGLLVDAFVSIPGASDVVLGAEVTYASELKIALLGVDEEVLAAKGAVSAEVASQMAQGVCAVGQGSLELQPGQVIALATTGNAGPDGEPVGQVFIALSDGKKTKVTEFSFSCSRAEIRKQSVEAAISMLREHLGL